MATPAAQGEQPRQAALQSSPPVRQLTAMHIGPQNTEPFVFTSSTDADHAAAAAIHYQQQQQHQQHDDRQQQFLLHSQSASPPSSYAQHAHSLFHPSDHGTGRPSALRVSPSDSPLAAADAPLPQHDQWQRQVSQSASPPYSETAHAEFSNSGGGGGASSSRSASRDRRSKSILRKDVTPTGHRRGVSFNLPQGYLEEKERAKAAAAAEAAARKARVVEEAAAAQAVAAALLTAQMSSLFIYPQEGLSAAPLPIAAATAATSDPLIGAAAAPAPVPGPAPLMSRQQKTAFHPLTTPGPAAATAASGSSLRALHLGPIQIHPATASANAAKAAQAQSHSQAQAQAHALAASSVGAAAVPSPSGLADSIPLRVPVPIPMPCRERESESDVNAASVPSTAVLSPSPPPPPPPGSPLPPVETGATYPNLSFNSSHYRHNHPDSFGRPVAGTYAASAPGTTAAAGNSHPRGATSPAAATAFGDNRTAEHSFPATAAATAAPGPQYTFQPFQQPHHAPPLSNTLPRLSVGSATTSARPRSPSGGAGAAVSVQNCSPFSSGSNDGGTPLSSSSSSGSFGASGGGGGGAGGSTLYVRPGFPQNSSGGASVPAAASSTFSLRMGGPGSSASAYAHAAPRPAPPPFSPSPSPSPSTVYPGPGAGSSGGGAASSRPQAPPSPSKLARPFSFRWGSAPASAFGSGRGAPGPWAYCTQLLLPQARRSVARWLRSGKRAGLARVAGMLFALVGCICVFAMLLQLQPQRSVDVALQPTDGGVGGAVLPAQVDGTLAGAGPGPDGVGTRGEDAGRVGAWRRDCTQCVHFSSHCTHIVTRICAID
jgi:hypothetical protein